MLRLILAVLIIISLSKNIFSQKSSVSKEVLSEMDILYQKMRNIDLSWMEYLSDDATSVHNGTFLPNSHLIQAEKSFFNSLDKLEINVLMKPIVYELGINAAAITIKHSINTWYKSGGHYKDIEQTLTFIWHKRDDKWQIVHSHFVTSGATNK